MKGVEVSMRPKKRVPPDHDVRVEIGAGYSGRGYWFAECLRCRWAGPPREFKSAAELDAAAHTSPPQDTGGDR